MSEQDVNEQHTIDALVEQLNRMAERNADAVNGLLGQLTNYQRIQDVCIKSLKIGGVAIDPTEDEKAKAAEEAYRYVKMGMDFERMLKAIKGDDIVSAAWDDFLMTMRLAGLDQRE